MRMLSVLPRVTERTRERVAREFDDLGPDVCMDSIMRDLQQHNPELLDMASNWANDVGAADRIITAFGIFYQRHCHHLITLKPRVAPSEIRSKIEEAFRRSAEIDAKRINVEATGGEVKLSGSVPSWAERQEAEAAAWRAPGVTKVDNRITITP